MRNVIHRQADGTMAVAQASRVRVEQHGDATFGLREEYLIDTETGLLVKRETLVAAVPVEGGKTALIVGQKTTAAVAESEDKVFVGQPKTAAAPVAKAADKPPAYSSGIRTTTTTTTLPTVTTEKVSAPARSYQVTPRPSKSNSKPKYAIITAILCGCLVWLAALAFVIAIPVAETLECDPLRPAAISSLVLGCSAAIMGCLCFSWVCIPVKSTAANALWCSVIGINLLVFIAAVIASSVFVFTNSVDFISCAATALPFGLTILSYVLLDRKSVV